MSMNDIQFTFQLCSYLLSYPDKQFYESLPLLENELNVLDSSEVKQHFKSFLHLAKQKTNNELIGTYVNTFDFGRKTNLYITYMTSGEQRERGVDLLYLKNYYKLNGFDVTEQELPDFLPIMLEFASHVNSEVRNPIFSKYFDNIKEISDRIEREDNLYEHIFKGILFALSMSGVTKSTRRSEELCLNNYYG